MRQEELFFLGMAEKPKTKEEEKKSSVARIAEIEAKRKIIQKQVQEEYKNEMTLTKELIKQNEEFDIKDRMIDERRNWYIDYQRDHNGKLPKSMKEFAERFDVEIPDPNKLAEDEAKGGKKKDKGDKKPKEKKEKGKGKKGEKKEPKKEYIWTGATTDVVVLLQEKTDKFVNVWEKKDETDKAFNKFDTEMIKEEVKPKVEKEIEKVVDKMMEMELENLELLMGKKGKKKKKKKAKKTKKKKAKKMPPALKLIAKKTTYELLNELFVLGIAKKINKPHRIVDFQGEIQLYWIGNGR